MTAIYAPTDKRGKEKTEIAKNSCNALFDEDDGRGSGRYSLIVADPPWSYSLRETDATHRGRTPYPNMEAEDILSLAVGSIAAKDAYLLLWTTNNHLPLAFKCVEAWGFEYKTTHTWVKLSKKDRTPRIGMGHYGRNCTEHFIVAKRGKIKSWTSYGLTKQPTVIQTVKSDHSVKPEEFWVLANKLKKAIGGEAIELFSRKKRVGWDAWGNEV